jgi:hypothetical protein
MQDTDERFARNRLLEKATLALALAGIESWLYAGQPSS